MLAWGEKGDIKPGGTELKSTLTGRQKAEKLHEERGGNTTCK